MSTSIPSCVYCNHRTQDGVMSSFFYLSQNSYSFPCQHEFHVDCIPQLFERAMNTSKIEIQCSRCTNAAPIIITNPEMTILNRGYKLLNFASIVGQLMVWQSPLHSSAR